MKSVIYSFILPVFSVLILLFSNQAAIIAQTYVTIPDSSFAVFLKRNYPSSMSGNKLDITSTPITVETKLNVAGLSVKNLQGLQYFTSLRDLRCGENELLSLPDLPAGLNVLDCSNNYLSALPSLPDSLFYLDCSGNAVSAIPPLPQVLETFYCDANALTVLPALPPKLSLLNCSSNRITALPALPDSLESFSCNNNRLTSLPVLPNVLKSLNYANNTIPVAPPLPDSLVQWACAGNQMTSMPALPVTLEVLLCENNFFTVLPVLPPPLKRLYCQRNQLTALPALPAGLELLYCQLNQLTALPQLPASLKVLICHHNQVSCFPEFPQHLSQLDFSVNLNSCVPNYVPAMGTSLLPLCVAGDALNNPNGCMPARGILGSVSQNAGSGCGIDAAHSALPNVLMKLYNNSDVLMESVYTSAAGLYDFPVPAGTYTVRIDPVNKPYQVQCAFPGADSTVVLTAGTPFKKNVNFSIGCKPGFDVGVQSIVAEGDIFPGREHTVHIAAGDITQWYGMDCLPAGVGGAVHVKIIGPIGFTAETPYGLAPENMLTVLMPSGPTFIRETTFSYTIADFSAIQNTTAFGFRLATASDATMEDDICIEVRVVTNAGGDYNPSNNTYRYCYEVRNSHDPNAKEVFPSLVEPGFSDYLTYTIHFQNTGNAQAYNIVLADTLDQRLDPESLEILNYSHENSARLTGNVLTFSFPNILLPDSTSNEPASHGFVQYRIRPKAGLPAGTLIENTAYIFFDFNAAIITNTALTEYIAPSAAGIKNDVSSHFTVYPNPGKGLYTVQLSTGDISQTVITLYSLTGERIETIVPQQGTIELDLADQPNGVYLLAVSGPNGSLTQRLIKQ